MPVTFYNDADGSRVMRTEPNPVVAPTSHDTIQYQHKPMTPEEAAQWAKLIGRFCIAGAACMTVLYMGSRLLFHEAAIIQSNVVTASLLGPSWIAALSAPAYILISSWVRRANFEKAMNARLAPPTTGEDDGVEDDETDDAPRAPELPTPSDKMYDKCVAVLTYAFKRGGTAPVPRTTRNGTASLVLATGGTLDGNDYPAVAALLRDRYGLLAGGDGKPWKLTQGWPSLDALLDAFDAAFDRRALGLE